MRAGIFLNHIIFAINPPAFYALRLLGVLAVCVWLFVTVTVVVDMLGLDWLDRLSTTANRFLGTPSDRSVTRGAAVRNSTLRSIGSGFRR